MLLTKDHPAVEKPADLPEVVMSLISSPNQDFGFDVKLELRAYQQALTRIGLRREQEIFDETINFLERDHVTWASKIHADIILVHPEHLSVDHTRTIIPHEVWHYIEDRLGIDDSLAEGAATFVASYLSGIPVLGFRLKTRDILYRVAAKFIEKELKGSAEPLQSLLDPGRRRELVEKFERNYLKRLKKASLIECLDGYEPLLSFSRPDFLLQSTRDYLHALSALGSPILASEIESYGQERYLRTLFLEWKRRKEKRVRNLSRKLKIEKWTNTILFAPEEYTGPTNRALEELTEDKKGCQEMYNLFEEAFGIVSKRIA